MTNTIPPISNGNSIAAAARIIRDGGVVAFPTETVYGLGANAFDPQAVSRIFAIKRRPRFDPLIVHISDFEQIHQLTVKVTKHLQMLAKRFWPGPLTVVVPKTNNVPGIVTAGLTSVGIRMPAHLVARELIRQAGVPIAAPSANVFGSISPTTACHVVSQLGDRVDYILDGGPCQVGIESTIVSLMGNSPTLLRPGGIPCEDIESVLGPLSRSENQEPCPQSPGRLPHHYAPRTPLVLRPEALIHMNEGRVGLLSLVAPKHEDGFSAIEILSSKGDLVEAAANLFAALHRLDNLELDLIVAVPVPGKGLGRAINDRLRRAAYRKENTDEL